MIYGFSSRGSFSKVFGLRDQLRRAAVSIMSNIAEGFESLTQSIFLRYLGYAKASAGEVRAQLYIARDPGYLSSEEFDSARSLAETCSKQLARFVHYLENQPNTRRVREDGATYDTDV